MRSTEEILVEIELAKAAKPEVAPMILKQAKKNIILDATLMTGLMTCGRFAELRYDKSLVQITGKSNSLECGSIIHKIFETFYGERIKGFKHTDALANALTSGETYIRGCQYCTDFESTDEVKKPVCGHTPNEYPGVRNTPAESQTKPNRVGWKHVLQTAEEYFDFYKNDFWVPLFVETVKRKVVYEDDEIRVMWKAKLDAAFDTNQGIFPVDHKTMQQRKDSLPLNNQFKGQCLVMETHRMFVNKVGFQTSLKPEEKFTRVPISYSTDALLEFQSEIIPMAAYNLLQYSESGYWPATGHGINCEGKFGNCVFHEVCSSDRNMREETLRNNFVIGPKWDIENLEKD
jgi:hypothetical protein